jgi:RNA recognition motif-containing protein
MSGKRRLCSHARVADQLSHEHETQTFVDVNSNTNAQQPTHHDKCAPRVFIARLLHDCDESSLNEFFSPRCEVTGTWIVRDKETGISRNFGFVELAVDDDHGNALPTPLWCGSKI